MEETSLLDIKESSSGGTDEKSRNPLKKIIFFAGIILIFLIGFTSGILYFFNPSLVIKYIASKQNIPLEIDTFDFGPGGGFELERLRYNLQVVRGESERLQIEFAKGDLSVLGFLFSNKLKLETNLTGVKVPLNAGFISGGNWTINADIGNITKNTQQWNGDIEINIQNANLQYKVMETSYTALIRDGKITGKLANGLITLDSSRINADIATVLITGNSTVNYPYNLNIQVNITPQSEFSKKYPDEQSMLQAIMQDQTEIIVNFSGPLNQIKPKVQNIKLPGF